MDNLQRHDAPPGVNVMHQAGLYRLCCMASVSSYSLFFSLSVIIHVMQQNLSLIRFMRISMWYLQRLQPAEQKSEF